VGLALSDRTCTLATPLVVLERTPDLHQRIAAVVAEEEVQVVVVGLPRSLDGRERGAAQAARAEAEALDELLDVPVEMHDERLSTVVAHAGLAAGGRSARQRRGIVDAAAAAVFLQSWLDAAAGSRSSDSPEDQ